MTDGVANSAFPANGATQPAAAPPFMPEQDHVHGPEPLTGPIIPAAHNPVSGVVRVTTPLAEPQAPSTGAGGKSGAVQLTVMPPLRPMQLQFQGPSPLTEDTTPDEHKLSTGTEDVANPLAVPQFPSTEAAGGKGALGTNFWATQVPEIPPFRPEQAQDHGPSP